MKVTTILTSVKDKDEEIEIKGLKNSNSPFKVSRSPLKYSQNDKNLDLMVFRGDDIKPKIVPKHISLQ